jgi:hypothetical protein
MSMLGALTVESPSPRYEINILEQNSIMDTNSERAEGGGGFGQGQKNREIIQQNKIVDLFVVPFFT